MIVVFGPLSGAHFNPAVSIAFALRGKVRWSTTAIFIVAQILGAVSSVWMAHLTFDLPLWQLSVTTRTGPGLPGHFRSPAKCPIV
jgi:glycerol uptake facilitator-like aquaporin